MKKELFQDVGRRSIEKGRREKGRAIVVKGRRSETWRYGKRRRKGYERKDYCVVGGRRKER
jgi:hypothetical protein